LADPAAGKRLTIRWSPIFRRDYQCLPAEVQARADKAIRLLQTNPRHPSLQAKKMQGGRGIWEARVSISHRITFELAGDTLVLRRIGTHDVLRNG